MKGTQTDQRSPKKSRLYRWSWSVFALALAVSAVMLVSYCGSSAMHRRDVWDQKECDDYCTTNYNQKGVLVPIIPNQRTRPDASMGPFKCTCPR